MTVLRLKSGKATLFRVRILRKKAASRPSTSPSPIRHFPARRGAMASTRRNDQIGGPKMVHAGCWSHAERYFSEAVQLNPKDPVATPIVARIDELFAIDAEARRQQ